MRTGKCFSWSAFVFRDAPIIGIGQLSAVLPIVDIGQLLRRYRPIVIYAIGKSSFYYSDNTCPSKRPFIEQPPVLSDHF